MVSDSSLPMELEERAFFALFAASIANSAFFQPHGNLTFHEYFLIPRVLINLSESLELCSVWIFAPWALGIERALREILALRKAFWEERVCLADRLDFGWWMAYGSSFYYLENRDRKLLTGDFRLWEMRGSSRVEAIADVLLWGLEQVVFSGFRSHC